MPVPSSDIEKVTLLRLPSVTHGFDQNQRYLELDFVTSGPAYLNVTAPANPNLAPPGYYMLFVVSFPNPPATVFSVPSTAVYVVLR